MPDESRILVVDDEPNICKSCVDMLDSKGMRVETVQSGQACLAKTENSIFDAMILDLKIPDISGTELLRQIKKRQPETPVIMITGYSTVASAVETMKLGAFDYLPKPFTPAELRTAVERALGRPHFASADTGARLITPETVDAALATPVSEPLYVVRVRPEVCYACLGCVVACSSDCLGLPEDAPLRLDAARLSVEAAGAYAVPLRCMQCADAPCMRVCPTGAMHRADPNGPVLADAKRCIGCRSCVLACPIGVLSLDPAGKIVQKCDFCIDRLQAGREPACVESCPTGALELVTVDQVREEGAWRGAQDVLRKLEAGENRRQDTRRDQS